MNRAILAPGGRVSAFVIVAAFIAYAVYQFSLWSDPWSSWGHVETISARPFLKSITEGDWSGPILDSLLNGRGIDTSVRFRPLSHAVELIDTHIGNGALSYYFAPLFANVSSFFYFLFGPFLALLVARRMLGDTTLATVVTVLAAGALLTSTGYVSAGALLFHPAKKLVIFVALLQLLFFVEYAKAPRSACATTIGICQLAMAWADETGLFAGAILSATAGVYALAHRRPGDLLRLSIFVAITALIPAFRIFVSAAPTGGEKPVDLQTAIQPLLSFRLFGPFYLPGEHFGGHLAEQWNQGETFYSVIVQHLEGAFSVLYGPSLLRWLVLLGLAASGVMAFAMLLLGKRRRAGVQNDEEVSQAGLMLLIGAGYLLANVMISTLLLNFGGRLFMSSYNYYYASFLPVAAFFTVLAAFRVSLTAAHGAAAPVKLMAQLIQVSLGIAVGACIVSNVVNVPRVNRLMGMIHFNPYAYGQVNAAAERYLRDGAAGLTVKRSVRIAQCSSNDMARSFERTIDQLDVKNPGTRADFLYFVDHPFIDERFLKGYLTLLLGQTPDIEIYPARGDEC